VGEIRIPKLNNNDDSYVLLEWLVQASTRVVAGDCVATLETSKAVSDLLTDETGYVTALFPAGAVCRPGDVVATVAAAPEHDREPDAVGSHVGPPYRPPANGEEDDGVVITQAARELMTLHAIESSAVAALGRRVVKAADIEALVSRAPNTAAARGEPLSTHQLAVARLVSRSHASVPAAFTVIKVDTAALRRRQLGLGSSDKAFIGIPELVVQAVAGLHKQFPRCFAEIDDDLTIDLAERADTRSAASPASSRPMAACRASA
jgi:2-oxoglutarate dehydrogenase E2 component (dihydrolipoamide succinyltransferase)